MKRWIERTISLKNRTIENLLHELEEAEEQYSNNLQAHLTNIDNMLGKRRYFKFSKSHNFLPGACKCGCKRKSALDCTFLKIS